MDISIISDNQISEKARYAMKNVEACYKKVLFFGFCGAVLKESGKVVVK